MHRVTESALYPNRNDLWLGFYLDACSDQQALSRTAANGEQTLHAAQDALQWEDERHFCPSGRLDQAVQVGGLNVFPTHVQRQSLEHLEVRDAAVRLMRPDEGNRLKAFIVLRDATFDAHALQTQLEAWSASLLAAAERPRAFTFGARLPTGPTGKPADWMIQ